MGAKLIITIDLTLPNAEATRLERIATELRAGLVPLSALDPISTSAQNTGGIPHVPTEGATGGKRGPAGVGRLIMDTLESARMALTVAEIAERIRQGGRPITNLQVTKSAWRLKDLGKLHSRGNKNDPKNFRYVHPDVLRWEDFGTKQDDRGPGEEGGQDTEDEMH